MYFKTEEHRVVVRGSGPHVWRRPWRRLNRLMRSQNTSPSQCPSPAEAPMDPQRVSGSLALLSAMQTSGAKSSSSSGNRRRMSREYLEYPLCDSRALFSVSRALVFSTMSATGMPLCRCSPIRAFSFSTALLHFLSSMWSLHLREKEKTSGVSLRRRGPGLPEELLLHAVLESEVCVEGHGRGSLVVRKVPVLLEEVCDDIGGLLLGIYARSIPLSQPIRGLLAPDNGVNLMPVTQNSGGRWPVCEVALGLRTVPGLCGADTLPLCRQLSSRHSEVWEAVCRIGSKLRRGRRACDRGTLRPRAGSGGSSEEGNWET
ncbi:hypothetical protein EYF80_053995 [Liparis tanakae]|uniref:Uncharacterized protein n=1 Tax=Liparis tanakae TaxID=230148 RepID=A0A4Z2F3W8_9TELE|nr:hypothetical protein EYF80_053995 [Liparis tanakae]